MQILNLGCGSVRPPAPFINVDSLHGILAPGTVERGQLDAEPNYVEHDIRQPLPFPDNHFNGVLLSHVLEHFDAISGTALLRECHRVLIKSGSLMVSVPDASYFCKVYPQDNKRNAMKLFGEGIPESEPKQTFLEYALLFTDHRMVFCEDSLWAMLVGSGFDDDLIIAVDAFNLLAKIKPTALPPSLPVALMHEHLNRRMFSLVMIATK